MLRVLVMGGSGMLGHKLAENFASRFETFATVRGDAARYRSLPWFSGVELVGGIDASSEAATDIVRRLRPDVVVNAIGVVKQDAFGKDPRVCQLINEELPHRLASAASEVGGRFIGISTDCVFSGTKGSYKEDDPPDAEDIYGLTKFRGEVTDGNALTLRTSIIGRELQGQQGLIEWFLSNRGGCVKGFRRAIFSGFPTCELADILGWVIEERQGLRGLYHLSSDPISKYDLLTLVNEVCKPKVEVVADDEFAIDRSLDSAKFRAETGFEPRSWPEMVKSMFEDSGLYEAWRDKC